MESKSLTDDTDITLARPNLYGIIAVVAVFAFAGVFWMSQEMRDQRERDLRIWQEKLNLIADSRAEEVSKWVSTQSGGLKKLAENPSLKLYFNELSSGAVDAEGAEPAQKVFIRNLLTFTSDRLGFSPLGLPMSVQIPTQIQYEASTGIALFDMKGTMVVATPYLSNIEPTLLEEMQKTPVRESALLDIRKNAEGKLLMGFVVPVWGIQDNPGEGEPIARVLGIKGVDEGLFGLLKHPGVSEKTLEISLVREENGNIVFLSPAADGTDPLAKRTTNDPATLAESKVVQAPNTFVIERNAEAREVLATGRNIAGTPWTLLVSINRDEALAASNARLNARALIMVLIIGLVSAGLSAVWYFTSSRRIVHASRHYRDVAERATAQQKLLKLVADHQPEAIYLLDKDLRYRFANRASAQSADMNAADMSGKPVSDVLGKARAWEIAEMCGRVMETGETTEIVRRRQEGGDEAVVRTQFVPCPSLPVSSLPPQTPGVLVVEQNITEVVHEREKRLRAHEQLVDMLLMMVDRRDPHAAYHSQMVSDIAYEVANAMRLEPSIVEAARIAGSLMNVGKIVLPAEVLTKTESLSDEERRSLREATYMSADLLEGVAFDVPVAATLRQSLEHWDGSGPQHIAGEDILLSARIVAVANAFAGMTSPRGWRPALTIDAAIEQLLAQENKQFDRKVVVALIDFIDNHGGRVRVQEFLEHKAGKGQKELRLVQL